MSVLQDNLKKVDTTPFFAAVGATDLAVEKVRDARVRAEAARVRAEKVAVDFDPASITTQVKELPALALNQTLVVGGKVVESYESLATRGKGLVTRLRTQQATKDLVAQAETTVAQAKGAVTTARKAVLDIRSSALATLTTGRHEAAHVAEIVIDTVAEDAEVAATDIKAAAKRTRTAAKRTNTTATKAAKRTTSSAKATTTSARKTAAGTTKATAKAAEKVGD
jgi:hypothetical protein